MGEPIHYYSSQFKSHTTRIAQFFAKNWKLLTCTTVFLIFAFYSPMTFCRQNHDSLSPELRGPSMSQEMVYDADLRVARIIRRRLGGSDSLSGETDGPKKSLFSKLKSWLPSPWSTKPEDTTPVLDHEVTPGEPGLANASTSTPPVTAVSSPSTEETLTVTARARCP